ncbi:MAG: hypothetical protein GQ545_09415 [Candidatus Aminicenantes bacterium]|nr:hypothetical protein [Candidatus Aminicenantes bacterium]
MNQQKTSKEALKIFPTLLGCHQELLLNNTRRRRPFGFKGQLKMTDDPVDCLRFFDKGYDSHLATTCGTTQGIHFIDLADHLGPTFGRHIGWIVFCDKRIQRITACLTDLPPVGIGVEAVLC